MALKAMNIPPLGLKPPPPSRVKGQASIRLPPPLPGGRALPGAFLGGPLALSLLLTWTRALAGGWPLGGNSVGGAVMAMTTALGQKKKGKDALPPLEPEVTSSPVFPHKRPPTYPFPTSSNGSAEAKPAKLGMVDIAQGRGGGHGACFR